MGVQGAGEGRAGAGGGCEDGGVPEVVRVGGVEFWAGVVSGTEIWR